MKDNNYEKATAAHIRRYHISRKFTSGLEGVFAW